MPTYSTPGVYVNESLFSSLTPNTSGSALTVACFLGEAERGPTTPQYIGDWSSFKALYGELQNKYDLGYAVFHYFANGGRNAWIVRVLDAAAVTSQRASFPFYPTGAGNASASLFAVQAISPGVWGNSVTVQTLPGTIPSTATTYGTFTLVVQVGGVEVERFIDLSLDPNNSRYAPAIVNNYSQFIRISGVTTAAASAGSAFNTVAFGLAGGSQGTVVDTDYSTALDQVDLVDGRLLLNAVGQTGSTVITSLVTKAAARGDSFVIIDPLKTDTTLAAIQATASNFAGVASPGYAAQYVPMLEMIDPGKTGAGAVRTTYPGGAVAGLYVRTEIERTVAKAPAGYAADVRGALGLTTRLSDAQIGILYDGTPQVNTFKAVTGAGVTVFGARTLSKTRPDKFVSVRRTLNYLKASLKELTRFAVFEPNDVRLWTQLNMVTSGFLSDFWRAGGLKGSRANEAFFVICDSTNNTANSIDQGMVNVSVGVALTYPAEFVIINLSQWTGGSNTVEQL